MPASLQSVRIAAASYRLPAKYVPLSELRNGNGLQIKSDRERLQIPKLGSLDLNEIEGVHVFGTEERGDLALEAIRDTLSESDVDGRQLDVIIDYSTVSRADNGLSLSYRVQDQLQADRAFLMATGNGSCVAFQIALKAATALFHSDPSIQQALLFSEDRILGHRDNAPFNVLGDGASAVLLQRSPLPVSIVGTLCISRGQLRAYLGINHSQSGNFDFDGFEQHVVPLYYKHMRDVALALLRKHDCSLDDVALVLYQNMSDNDYVGITGALGIARDRIYPGALRGHGHIFGADLVINLSSAMRHNRIHPGARILMLSSGAGFSWAATLLKA